MDYLSAKEDLLTVRTNECLKFLSANNLFLELGYFYLLSEDLSNAKKEFDKVQDCDIRAHWANFLVGLIDGKIKYYPSYLELRNFFECDLDVLMKNYKGDYVQIIVNYSDFLSNFNGEVNKYIARTFLNNNYKNYAYLYFTKAKGSFYNDPELHFLIAQTKYRDGLIEEAIESANKCLEILPKYYPALKLIESVSNGNYL